jgi:hypothetical protein
LSEKSRLAIKGEFGTDNGHQRKSRRRRTRDLLERHLAPELIAIPGVKRTERNANSPSALPFCVQQSSNNHPANHHLAARRMK